MTNYITGQGRANEDHGLQDETHIYEGTFSKPGKPLCERGWNRNWGTSYSRSGKRQRKTRLQIKLILTWKKIMKTWWTNNSWRFWAIRWALSREPYEGLHISRFTPYPQGDERYLADMIDDYAREVDAVLRNPMLRAIFWLKRNA